MSIHKLTAGSGYDYLTRQVAALDATEVAREFFGGARTAAGGCGGAGRHDRPALPATDPDGRRL